MLNYLAVTIKFPIPTWLIPLAFVRWVAVKIIKLYYPYLVLLNERFDETPFAQRVEADKESSKSLWRNKFIASIKEEAATRVRVYEEKPPVYFTDSAGLGKAINDALALPLLAR